MQQLPYFLCFFLFISLVGGQQAGSSTKNQVLKVPMEECQAGESCSKISTTVTLDANWRWIHDSSSTNCYTGNLWDASLCPDAATCTENCFLEGVDENSYRGTYGITVDGSGELELKFVTQGPYSTNIGSRMYLLDESGESYYMFKLKNKEFTFDVDVSDLPCGLNGALYFVEMEEDGGLSYSTNECGAAYGTGYCDAQCPHDIKWINGEANCEDWQPSDNDANSGKGHYGSCCYELDIWEANSISTAYTNHPCETTGQYRCEGLECGDNDSDNRYDGVCDKDGCDYNHWRQGDKSFFGPGGQFTVDSTKPMTVVTQFLTNDGTDNGELVEMRRLYVQDGKIIENSISSWPGMQSWDSISQPMCDEQKAVFDDPDDHSKKGGLKAMGDSMDRGHVLVMSLWDDHDVNMLWLDSDYPLDKDPSEPGVSRGSCSRDSGKPEDMESNHASSTVTFSKIRIGPHGSTYPGGQAPPAPTTTPGPDPTTTQGGDDPTTTSGNSNCPGGNLDTCISLCPSQPSDLFQNCVQQCMQDCA